MQATIDNPYGPTSRAEIAQFETRQKLSLPDEYKAFLLKYNGGMPTPNGFAIPGWHGQESSLGVFYGIHEHPDYSLDGACETYEERVPADLIPIGTDAFGNNVCMGWKGKRRGKVYFWDHEDELDEHGRFRQDYGNVYPLANSLTEFLNNLREWEDEECE
ncbi:SMI1/KNR4 family protein [Polyangium spumosum]|uniref:SMI1/KNR4 family protein n=1 Tax=Polyangium spumosum TaxID=889282 RepID=A0A6N7Q6C9_9BACT|nr:SMI1/KNR4 family protein [Polyangium spumosum]MRG98460.1 SMI1/KNR4 family protein [Polyangium spumosum]